MSDKIDEFLEKNPDLYWALLNSKDQAQTRVALKALLLKFQESIKVTVPLYTPFKKES